MNQGVTFFREDLVWALSFVTVKTIVVFTGIVLATVKKNKKLHFKTTFPVLVVSLFIISLRAFFYTVTHATLNGE